jgi:hypothetical protein
MIRMLLLNHNMTNLGELILFKPKRFFIDSDFCVFLLVLTKIVKNVTQNKNTHFK